MWLTKDPAADPIEKGNGFERGTYIIFDPSMFSRVETPKDFTLTYESLEDRPALMAPQQQSQQQQSTGQQQMGVDGGIQQSQQGGQPQQQVVTAGGR
jgi:CCR4-NOT transcription complex subunit 2